MSHITDNLISFFFRFTISPISLRGIPHNSAKHVILQFFLSISNKIKSASLFRIPSMFLLHGFRSTYVFIITFSALSPFVFLVLYSCPQSRAIDFWRWRVFRKFPSTTFTNEPPCLYFILLGGVKVNHI